SGNPNNSNSICELKIGDLSDSDFNSRHLRGSKVEGASAAAAAQPKLPDRATKVKGADEANRRLMALSEEDRRSVFLRILALANLRRDHAHLLSSAAKQWNVQCRGGPSYVIKVGASNGGI